MKKEDLARISITGDKSVREAMRQIDATGFKILFVVDAKGTLMGTLTDGDIRKWILAGKGLDDRIEFVFNRNPIRFREDFDIEEVRKVLVDARIESVPVVDAAGKLVDALFWEEALGRKYRRSKKEVDLPVVIMAGGIGSRFSTVTKILPKPLIPFGEKPVVEVIMDNFAEVGCGDFYLLLGYKGAMIQSYFENSNNSYEPNYVFETEPSGTAGALRFLDPKVIPGSFFVSNCDIVVDADYADIYDLHKKKGCDITVVGAMRHFVIPYGVMELADGGTMKSMTEKPQYDFVVNTGMYVVDRSVLPLIPEKGVFHFTDLIKKVQGTGGKVAVYPVSERSWFDIGQPGLWEESTSRLEEKKGYV